MPAYSVENLWVEGSEAEFSSGTFCTYPPGDPFPEWQVELHGLGPALRKRAALAILQESTLTVELATTGGIRGRFKAAVTCLDLTQPTGCSLICRVSGPIVWLNDPPPPA